MRKLTTLLLLMIVCAVSAQGQDQLVMASGDTLTGKIDILFPDKLYEEISFDNGDKKKRMRAYEFVGFIKGDEIYKSIKNGEKYQIMRLKKPGYLSLFEYRIDDGYNFAGLYAWRRDGAGVAIPSMSFKKVMTKFTEDCNNVSIGVKEGRYKRRDIERLVDDYNGCISQNTVEQRNLAAQPEVEISEESSALVDEANSIMEIAKSTGDNELASMLEDLIEKIQEGEDVPFYLKKAIEDQVKEDSPIHSQITALLKKL